MFDRIFYINLDRRPDRRKNIESQIKRVGLQSMAERIEAVDGRKLDINKVDPNVITEKGKKDALDNKQRVYIPLTKGGIGCAMSHRKAYEKILDENLDAALILEDDSTLSDDFLIKMQELEGNVPKDYDMLFLGYAPSALKYFYPKNNKYYGKTKKIYGLYGYIVTKEGAKKLLSIFPISEQIDTEITNNLGKIKAYVVEPEYRTVYSEPSSLHSTYGTDIQLREAFSNDSSDNSYMIGLVILIIIIFLLGLYL